MTQNYIYPKYKSVWKLNDDKFTVEGIANKHSNSATQDVCVVARDNLGHFTTYSIINWTSNFTQIEKEPPCFCTGFRHRHGCPEASKDGICY